MTDTVADVVGKLRPEIKARWVAALRSGEYQQGTGYLHYRDQEGADRFCCLGVLCDVAVQEGVVEPILEDFGVPAHTVEFSYDGSASMPPDTVRGWAYSVGPVDVDTNGWRVPAAPGDDETETGPTTELVHLNDDKHLSFAEIADRIEESL